MVEEVIKPSILIFASIMTFIYVVNAPIIRFYLDKRTAHKNNRFMRESGRIMLSMVFFAFIWVFFAFIWVFYQDKLRQIRKDNFYVSEIERYKRHNYMYSFDRDLVKRFEHKIAMYERYVKMRRIQKKIKKKRYGIF